MSRYARQELLYRIGKEGQEKINKGKVVIIGCGALGTHIANSLARAGVGKLHIVDRDFIETHNLQRQVLFTEQDVKEGIPKAIAARENLKQVNSDIEITSEVVDVNFTNVERLIEGYDVVVDGTDNFSIRYLLNDACNKLNIPWVYGGGIATGGMSMTIVPGVTPCFACQFPSQPPSELIMTCDTAGVVSSAIAISSSVQSVEVLKLLMGKYGELNRKLFSFDVWTLNFKTLEVKKNDDCSVCVHKKYQTLEGHTGVSVSKLCGQNSIQLQDVGAKSPDFTLLQEAIEKHTEVKANKFMLKFCIDEKDVTIFKDGRTIIKGITDEVEAKTFYNKYVGG